MIKQLSKMQLIFKTQCLIHIHTVYVKRIKKIHIFCKLRLGTFKRSNVQSIHQWKNVPNRCYFCEILNYFYWKHFSAKMTWVFMYQSEEHFSRSLDTTQISVLKFIVIWNWFVRSVHSLCHVVDGCLAVLSSWSCVWHGWIVESN